MSNEHRVVIVGAGPAGVRAAETLVAAGIKPIVLDENARWGGQIYRQPPANGAFQRSKKTLYGFEAHKAEALHTTMATLLPHLDYRPDTLAWACAPGRLDTLHAGREISVPFSHLIIASGATDRVLPVPGWTLPGVYTLGAAQVALKAQGCAIGQRVVLAGTGPLLYLVAYQYVKAGAQVVAVLDSSPLSQQIAATPKLARQPATFAKGLYYVGWLKMHGVRIERDVNLIGIHGDQGVSAIEWRSSTVGSKTETLACDAVGISFGLKPETQLADLAGCRFRFDAHNRCWLPELDPAGRSYRARHLSGGRRCGHRRRRRCRTRRPSHGIGVTRRPRYRESTWPRHARRSFPRPQPATYRCVSPRYRSGICTTRKMRSAMARRYDRLPLRRNRCRHPAALHPRWRSERDQSTESAHARRHGPLPGPHVR